MRIYKAKKAPGGALGFLRAARGQSDSLRTAFEGRGALECVASRVRELNSKIIEKIDQTSALTIRERILGDKLVQVCIGRHDLRLGFATGMTVSVTTELRVSDAGGRIDQYYDFPKHGTEICQLINQSVVELTWGETSVLSIEFTNGQRLDVVKAVDGFDSFTIEYGEVKFCD
ncbi:MAG: DUF6188 family protein [Pseudomonadota bacterium]